MKCKVIVLGLTSLIAMFLFGCGSKDISSVSESVGIEGTTEVIGEEGSPIGQIAFHVRYVYPSGKAAKIAVVDTMTAYVYESDDTKIAEADLEKVGDRGKASITVPAGDNRRVDLVAYDGGLVSWMGSDQDVDVVAGQTTTVEITMESTIPILADLPDTNTTGTYTVSWGGVPGATLYTLEENGTEAYIGANTFVAISEKREGSYSYRVKAKVGEYGDSPWSNVDSIEVGRPGTIDIDVPWPPDQETGEADGTVPQFTSDHPDLEIYGDLNITQLGYGVRIIGEITNKGTGAISVSSVSITLLARNGTILGYGTGGLGVDVVPGGTKPFTVDVPQHVSIDEIAGGRVSFEAQYLNEEGGTEGAKPILSVVSPLAVVYQYSYVDATATVTGEVENSGSIDAHDVVLQLTARNASGTAMDQASKTIGDVPAGSKLFFSLTFTQRAFSSAEHPMSYCDYEITYDEGGPDTGRVEVK